MSLFQQLKAKQTEMQRSWRSTASDPGDRNSSPPTAAKLCEASPGAPPASTYATPSAAPWQQQQVYAQHREQQQAAALEEPLSQQARYGLLAAAAALLIFAHACSLWHWLQSGSVLLADVFAVACLLIACSGQLQRLWQPAREHCNAVAEAVSTLPRMGDNVEAMLHEMRLMREDLHSLKAKAAWLPGS